MVLIKSSFERFKVFVKELKSLLIKFAYSNGDLFCDLAAFSTFCPCSSVPVKNFTLYPSNLLNLAKTSQAILVYACPICGLSFT